tara:strand:- start:66 stop:857 length:792 start_codon:yes stop_codon:yes gene_type:complete
MNFFDRHRQKLTYLLFIIYCGIFVLFTNFFPDLPRYSSYIVFFLPLVAGYFFYNAHEKKKRVIDLKEYAAQHDYNFYEMPDEDQVGVFKKFKSTKIINGQDKFFNLLVPNDNNQSKPLIVTGKSVVSGGESSTTYYTQIFLYKNNAELPKFFIQRKNTFDTMLGERREYTASQQIGIELYKFKKKEFPHNRYFFFSEDPNIENFISNKFIELLNAGINSKKALINIESNGINLIFYKQWSRHSIEFMDFYSNLFRVLKESLIK